MLSVSMAQESRRTPSVSIFCPGNQIPEWFNHQTEGSSIHVKLPPHWFNTNFLGFAVCIVVVFDDYTGDWGLQFHCDTHFKTEWGESHASSCRLYGWGWGKSRTRVVNSEHLLLWYDLRLYLNAAKVKGGANWSNASADASFDFYPVDDAHETNKFEPVNFCNVKVKKCGVSLLYAQDAEKCGSIAEVTKAKRCRHEFEASNGGIVNSGKEDNDEPHPKRI